MTVRDRKVLLPLELSISRPLWRIDAWNRNKEVMLQPGGACDELVNQKLDVASHQVNQLGTPTETFDQEWLDH